jgi:HAD superfamily hydrolase (TIGR01549 family)
VFESKKAILLDMNGTFMFGEDRFGSRENYSEYYHGIGGKLEKPIINKLVTEVYDYLAVRYPDEQYRHNFPSIQEAISEVSESELSNSEVDRVIETFSFHEHGHIPPKFIDTLVELERHYVLAAVTDIWAPKRRWVRTFRDYGIDKLFSAISFSSDHGMVKPSAKPFESILQKIGCTAQECLVIGDSIDRDLAGATAVGVDCVLVGDACDSRAVACYPSLLEFEKATRA